MRVALYYTCLVDLMRPRIGFAAIELLEAAGCDVVVPRTQTCCGQPGYNSGDRRSALALARKAGVDAGKVREDVLDDFCTLEHAREVYGVVLDERLNIDMPATQARRAALRSRPQ